MLVAERAVAQGFGEHIGGCHRILDRQVDADAGDWRHGVCRIADAQEARSPPALEAIDLDGKHADVVPRLEGGDLLGEPWHQARKARTEGVEALCAQRLVAALGDHIAALPVAAAVDRDQDLAGAEPAERLVCGVGPPRKLEPEDVHRRAEIAYLHAGAFTQGGMAAVGRDAKIGVDLEIALVTVGANPGDPPLLLDQAGRLGRHAQREGRVGLGLLGQKIEKVPLRHQRDELAGRRQVAEVGEADLR